MPDEPITFQLTVAAGASPGVPAIDVEFGRVGVLMGGNGVGKSKLLAHLAGSPSLVLPHRPAVYVEGGRVAPPPDTLKLNRGNFNDYSNLAAAERQYTSRRTNKLAARIESTFLYLKVKGSEMTSAHSAAVTAWQEAGEAGPSPRIGASPLESLFELFGEVFPSIELEYDRTSDLIWCRKGDSRYQPSALSDGEKQALCLLADLGVVADQRSIFLVDEPELNLNAAVAQAVWSAIELARPDAVFVYATHSIPFAARSSVDTLVVLAHDGQARRVSGIDEADPEVVGSLLGALPAVLSSGRAVGVEGVDTSFDSVFFRWLSGRRDVTIVPMGGGEDVVAGTKRRGLWAKVAPGVSLAGVIDRDFRSDTEIAAMAHETCLVLEFHEAEAYLLLPHADHPRAA